MRLRIFYFFILVLSLGLAQLHAADPANTTETRLREALRNLSLQLRDAQTQVVTLQAAQNESDAKNQALTAQVADLTRQNAEGKAAAEKSITELTTRLTGEETQLSQFKSDLQKSQSAYQKASDLATHKETDRAKLATQVIQLQRRVDDQQTKNTAMFKIGNEILKRYEQFNLGTALTAREPFIGTTRVHLENLIQDYHDQLSDQTIKP